MAHTYGAVRTVNGRVGDLDVPAEAGDTVRVRVVNTDNAPMPLWSDAAYRVVAVDGTEVHRPQEVADQGLLLTAGGRLDVQITVPADGSARLQLSRGTAVVIGSKDRGEVARSRRTTLDLLGYGTPAPVGFDPVDGDPALRLPDRSATRLRQGPARDVLVDQRPPLPERADVRGA